MKITEITITPLAFGDPPLLNSNGLHEPWALRAVLEVHTDEGLVGLGETYGDWDNLERMRAVAPSLIGLDPFAINTLAQRVVSELTRVLPAEAKKEGAVNRTLGAFEVAFLDLQGKALGRPVSDLLGGAVRESVPYSAYLFYKWAEHPGAGADEWGEALDPAGIVRQAEKMVAEYGFGSIKLKGGVFPPEQEIEAILALRERFPEHPLRLDPNTAWTVPTSLRVAKALDGVLEYLEDPTPSIEGMAEVAATAPMPLATNMCVVAFEHLPAAVAHRPVEVLLSDHHYWGGLTRSRELATLCRTFDISLSMHSNSHLGISLAAMTHLAAATPNLAYACDTHYPWNHADDVVKPGVLSFSEGSVRLPSGPGLGVELDHETLARLHENYQRCGLRSRDDTGYLRRFNPDYEFKRPRW
jgi:glucarate dehydratase